MFTIERRGKKHERGVYTKEDTSAINALLEVLSPKRSRILTTRDFLILHEDPNDVLVVARANDSNRIIGMAFLSFKTIPSQGLVACVDDFVILPDWQKQGIGAVLDEELRLCALEEGAEKIILTSNPKRKEANHFYKNRGYVKKGTTNMYVLDLMVE